MAKGSAALNQAVQDILKNQQKHDDLLKQQVLFEVIQIVSVCETYEEFRKAMFGMAVEYMKQMEAEGFLPKGTANAKQAELLKEDK